MLAPPVARPRLASAARSSAAVLDALQAKLRIGALDDAHEREADRIADQIVRAPGRADPIASSPPRISRKCAACAEEEVQRKGAGPPAAGDRALAAVQATLRSSGQPLDRATSEYFEPRFGQDFSAVRVHTGPLAERSARAVNALAYTVGHDVVFDAGRYAPTTADGRRLLAHELTHVVQQSGGSGGEAVHRSAGPALLQRQPAGCGTAVCVPGHEADPACAKDAAQEEARRRARNAPGTPLSPAAIGNPPAGVGLRVPIDPEAVTGIHDWSSDDAVKEGRAHNHNRFTVGAYTLGQICAIDEKGVARVFVYYVTSTLDDAKLAVGPDSLAAFTAQHGGVLVARATNHDGVDAEAHLDTRALPPAGDAFAEEPQIVYTAPVLPRDDLPPVPPQVIRAGVYRLNARLHRTSRNEWRVLYYIAEQWTADSGWREEWVVGPDWLDRFIADSDRYAGLAGLAFPFGRAPPEYNQRTARYFAGLLHGDTERAQEGKKAWWAAAKDPFWWLQIGMSYAGAAQGGPPVRTPTLRVIPGGGASAVSSIAVAEESAVGPLVSRGPVVQGGAATALAEPVPLTSPAPAPLPVSRPQGVPGWNPNPAPVAPRFSAPSPLVTAVASQAVGRISANAPIQAPRQAPQQAPRPDDDSRPQCAYATGRTPQDPIPMRWFKPRHDSFYPAHLALHGGHTIDRDDPDAMLPDGTHIGVRERYWPRPGKVVRLMPVVRTGEERRFRHLLARNGYVWSKTVQADHVQDPQWCGPDELFSRNFWPLETSTNQSAGGTQNNEQKVTFCPSKDGHPAIDWTVRDMKRAGFYGRYFSIQEISLVSDRGPGLTVSPFAPDTKPSCES